MLGSLIIVLIPLIATTHAIPTLATDATSGNTGLSLCASWMNNTLPPVLPSDFTFSGNIRRYYIAAEQISWNYAPTGYDNWMGVPMKNSPRAYQAGYTAPGSLGLMWEKAMYVGYTDATFTTRAVQPATHGLQGPTLRAEVGDMVEILFYNRLSENYASMHSMGLSYSKANEGSLYPNNSAPRRQQDSPVGDHVPPSGCTVYKWLINDGSAPTGHDASHMWAYHSFVSMQEDLNAGLIGPTIVYPRGRMNTTMASHREFTLLYSNFDESNSFMSAINAKRHGMTNTTATAFPPLSLGQGYGNESIWGPQYANLVSANRLSTTAAPLFRTLNGRVYANNSPFEVCVNDPTIWYVYSFGSAAHTFHMHGNGFVYQGRNLASMGLQDGTMWALPSTMGGVGSWQLICHVSNHDADGMVDDYVVYPSSSCPLVPLAK